MNDIVKVENSELKYNSIEDKKLLKFLDNFAMRKLFDPMHVIYESFMDDGDYKEFKPDLKEIVVKLALSKAFYEFAKEMPASFISNNFWIKKESSLAMKIFLTVTCAVISNSRRGDIF